MGMFHLLQFMILIHTGFGGIPLHYEVRTESVDRNGKQHRKREVDTRTNDERYLEEFNVIPKQKQYHGYSPEVPNFQVRKLSESINYPRFLNIPPPLTHPQFLNNHLHSYLPRHHTEKYNHFQGPQSPPHDPFSANVPYFLDPPYVSNPSFPSTVILYHQSASLNNNLQPQFFTPTPNPPPILFSPKLPPYTPSPKPTASPPKLYKYHRSVPHYLPSTQYQHPIPVYHSTHQNLNPEEKQKRSSFL